MEQALHVGERKVGDDPEEVVLKLRVQGLVVRNYRRDIALTHDQDRKPVFHQHHPNLQNFKMRKARINKDCERPTKEQTTTLNFPQSTDAN